MDFSVDSITIFSVSITLIVIIASAIFFWGRTLSKRKLAKLSSRSNQKFYDDDMLVSKKSTRKRDIIYNRISRGINYLRNFRGKGGKNRKKKSPGDGLYNIFATFDSSALDFDSGFLKISEEWKNI